MRALAAVSVLMLLVAGVTDAAAAECAGWTATIVGTSGRDVIVGTPGDDVIAGLGGNDLIRGVGGNDDICGGAGDDVIRSGRGQDFVRDGSGDDRVYTGSHPDDIRAGSGNDVFRLGAGENDTVSADGNGGDDAYYGGEGPRDEINAFGLASAVVFDLSSGQLEGGGIGLDRVKGFERASGTRHDDTLIGNAVFNILEGGRGDDHIEGREGNDRLFGFFSGLGIRGVDFLDGGIGIDRCVGETVFNCER
jgi:Ca2+-binding RTX toxin-like protein